MKLIARLILPSILLLTTSSGFAAAGGGGGASAPKLAPTGQGSTLAELIEYVLNLGGYLGYDLKVSPTSKNMSTPSSENGGAGVSPGSSTPPASISQNFLNLPAMQLAQNYLFSNSIGALLINTAAPSASPLVQNISVTHTFTKPPYNNVSTESVSVSPLIDQQPYQNDPVSQAVLNTLTTPSYSYCLNNNGTQVAECSYPSNMVNDKKVMLGAIGTLPSTQNYFTFNAIKTVLPQLNSNSLITPLMYAENNSNNSSENEENNSNQGLMAQSQSQFAANFIRYATGAVTPLQLPNRAVYDNLYLKAKSSDNPIEQQQAEATLANYLNSLRIYAAQSSVSISNLYYMLSKRLPQNQGTTDKPTSQALSEFKMATWRLFNPDQSANTQWINQINTASAATVQKEMVGLLAEINYQLYLSRQQQERILLTNTMLLIQSSRNVQPNANFGSSSK